MQKQKSFIDFICVGPQRTCSSWLDSALREHPSISLPTDVKETFFFDKKYESGLEWYKKNFKNQADDDIAGEIGPTYFESSEIAKRILSDLGHIKILVLMRNPVERTYSLFRHESSKGRCSDKFEDAIRENPRIPDSGRYSDLLPMWEKVFGEEKIILLFEEDISTDAKAVLRALEDSLNIPHHNWTDSVLQPHGQWHKPRIKSLHVFSSRCVSFMRNHGFHKLVNLGKSVGLNKLNRDRTDRGMPESVRTQLLEVHKADLLYIKQKYNRSYS